MNRMKKYNYIYIKILGRIPDSPVESPDGSQTNMGCHEVCAPIRDNNMSKTAPDSRLLNLK